VLGSWNWVTGGIRPARWGELELVAEWREFLREPDLFFRHLFDD